MKRLSSKKGRGTRIKRLHKREVSSLSADTEMSFYSIVATIKSKQTRNK